MSWTRSQTKVLVLGQEKKNQVGNCKDTVKSRHSFKFFKDQISLMTLLTSQGLEHT